METGGVGHSAGVGGQPHPCECFSSLRRRSLGSQWRRRRRASGTVIVCRYADDMVFGCQFEADGKQLLVDLKDRLLQFGLPLHEGKTRLIECGRPAARERTAAGQRRPETFDFLGFTHYWKGCGFVRATGEPVMAHASSNV